MKVLNKNKNVVLMLLALTCCSNLFAQTTINNNKDKETVFTYSKDISIPLKSDLLKYDIYIKSKKWDKRESIHEAERVMISIKKFMNTKNLKNIVFFKNSSFSTNKQFVYENNRRVANGFLSTYHFQLVSSDFGKISEVVDYFKNEKTFFIQNKQMLVAPQTYNDIYNNRMEKIIPTLISEEKKYSELLKSNCNFKKVSFSNNLNNYVRPMLFRSESKMMLDGPQTNSNQGVINTEFKDIKEIKFNLSLTLSCIR
jgi:hypothetical protein